MKKVLVSGYIGFNNFGDEAIFYALSLHLKSLGYDVSALCSNKALVKKTYQVKTYNYKKPFQILKALLSCDILFSGGGSLLQNKTSNFSLYYYLFIIILAKLFFKKVIIFAQGIEPIKGNFSKFITKYVLKSADYITVRDKKSLELLEKENIKAELVSDPVYSLIQDEEINKNKEGLIIQLRDYKNLKKDFLKQLAKSIHRNYRGKISVFALQKTLDEKICLEFICELEKLGISADYISDKTVDETIKILNSAKFVISMRLHALIVSNALKCRSFALIYDEKIKTLSDELNLKNIDIANYKDDELDNKLDEFFNHEINEVHPYRRFYWDCIDSRLMN